MCSGVYFINDIRKHPFSSVSNVIYCITNVINNKKYVGKTTTSLIRRISGHVNDAIIKCSKFAIHNAIRKYGVESFTIEVLERCSNADELSHREKYFINELNTLNEGYNMTSGGDGIVGFKHSDETKHAISSKKRGVKQREETRCKLFHPVEQFNIETGKIVARFESINDAINATSICNIGMCCSGKLKHSGGFGWRYVNEQDKLRCRWSNDMKQKMKERLSIENPLNTSVEQIDLKTGTLIRVFVSLNEAKAFTGATNISGVCRGIRKSSGGFLWRYTQQATH